MLIQVCTTKKGAEKSAAEKACIAMGLILDGEVVKDGVVVVPATATTTT